MAKAGGRVIKDAAAPLTEGGRTRLAGERFRDNASDFYALRESLDDGAPELVPGSDPTTFQATGDMGVGAMERGAAARNPDLFGDRRATQNAARVQAIIALQSEGAPETVAAAVRQQIKQIDDAAQAMVDDAATAARGSAERVGQGATPETAGTTLRSALEDARATAKATERKLWNAVDPDGSLALPATNAKTRAAQLVTDMPASAKTPSGEEKAIYDTLAQYDDVVPFSEVTALDSRLKAEMRAERLANGESPAYRRMSILKGEFEKDLETAIAGKVADEARAVKSGAIDAEQTVIARLWHEFESWRTQREATARQVGGTSAPGTGRSGTSTVSGSYRTEGQTRSRFGNAPRDPRLSADAANFDQAALERLNAARTATRERVETFDNRTLGPLRRRPSTVSNYDMPASAVPEKVFVAGPKGAETVQTFRNAVGDQEALDALQGFAVDRLRNTALRADGTLDPLKVKAFRTRYSEALRAFPELDAKFADAASASQVMDDAIRQQRQTVAEAEKGVLGKIMSVEDPADVTRSVGSIFSAQDSAQRMLKLRNAIGGDAEAKRGLRKAVVDHMTDRFVRNTEAGTSGVGTVKSDGFQNFVKTNRAALRNAGFSDAEIATMTRIADDLQRANRSIASVKNPGSNTAQDTLAVQKNDKGATLLAKVISSLAAPGAGGTAGYVLAGGGTAGAVAAGAGAIGAGVLAELRRQGLEAIDDIVTDALLNPDRARVLLRNVSTPQQEELAIKELARLFRRSSVPAAAISTSGDPPESVSAAAERAQQILLGGSVSARNHR
ncbi:hypothetical protein [Oricola indica]|uniref:hypothetical protein n=1 Tax=Oricola indica TaxID=2872591 RepID=UPI003CCBAC72